MTKDSVAEMSSSRAPDIADFVENEPTPARVRVLDEAAGLTAGDRNKAYGEPIDNLRHIAAIYNATTGQEISARDVAVMMNCVKMARRYHNPLHRDSYVDGAAYTAIEYEIATIDEQAPEGPTCADAVGRYGDYDDG